MPAQGVHEKTTLEGKGPLIHAPWAVQYDLSCKKQGTRLPIGTAHSTAKTGDAEQDPVPIARQPHCCAATSDGQADRAGWRLAIILDFHTRV